MRLEAKTKSLAVLIECAGIEPRAEDFEEPLMEPEAQRVAEDRPARADHPERHDRARDRGGPRRAVRAHRREPEMPEDEGVVGDDVQEVRADDRVDQGPQAVRGLQLLYQQREKLKESFLLELGLTYASALDSEALTDMAIDILREVAPNLSQRDDRRRLYLLASTIYEAHGQLQEALDALEGRL